MCVMHCDYIESDMLLHVEPLIMGNLQGETPTDLAVNGGDLEVARVLKGTEI